MKTELKLKCRLDHVDVLRGIGIIIMIMGHIGFGGKFDRYIHSFHMPLFFLISGYFFKIKFNWKFKDFIVQKARQLLIPYVSFGVFHYIIWVLAFRTNEHILSPIKKLVTYNTENLPIAGALWFFTALFFTEIIYTFIVYNVKNQKIAGVVIFIISIITSIITTNTGFRLPLTLDIALVAVGFYHIGKLLRLATDKYNIVDKLTNIPIKSFVIGMILCFINAVMAFMNGYVNMKSGWYAMVPITWINAIIGVSAFFVFSVFLDKKAARAKSILAFIGKNSIVYLCLNQLVIMILTNIIGKPIGNMGQVSLYGLYISVVILILSLALLSALVLLFNKTFLKFFIGK